MVKLIKNKKEKTMSKINSISIGNCGEYFVAAELERNGFTAAVPMSNTKSFDVLAINQKNDNQIALQVKTNHLSQKTWTLSQKNETLVGDNIYYVFVCLNGKDQPDYYIIHSSLVAKSIKLSHSNWLCGKTKDGKEHNDTNIRKFSFEIAKYNPYNLKAEDYKSNWQSLGKKYYDLTRFLPVFDTDFFGNWLVGELGDGSPEKPFHLPYIMYSDDIDNFASAVRTFIDDNPYLNDYQRILKSNNIEIETIKEVDVSHLDGECVCAMIVANILAEKFCEGAILTSCKDKTFIKWLERLKELDEK